MQATIDLPPSIFHQLEELAKREGATPARLIERLVSEYVATQPSDPRRLETILPLIPAAETGPIRPITGAELDDLIAREDRAS